MVRSRRKNELVFAVAKTWKFYVRSTHHVCVMFQFIWTPYLSPIVSLRTTNIGLPVRGRNNRAMIDRDQ